MRRCQARDLVRLVAWNCCAGPLDIKLKAIRSLRPDVLVLPESPRLDPSPHAAWIGENPRKGLGVIAFPPWRVQPIDLSATMPRYFLPVRVSGPLTFVLWAVWAHCFGGDRYVRATHRALDEATEHLTRERPFLLGDFNSHSRWDREHPPDLNHSALVKRLTALGYVSAYHEVRRKAHGQEGHPTFYEYRHRHRPYHIDYAFVPPSFRERLRRVSVGQHRRWTRWSDHMPLTIELSTAAL